MLNQINRVRSKVDQISYRMMAKVFNPMRGEKGVVGFEYLLVLAAVSVAIIAAMLLLGPTKLVKASCDAMNTVLPIDMTC